MYKFARGWRARAKRVITYRRVDLACKMHEEMYKAFAAADDAHLHRLTCAGLHSSLRARLAARPPRTAYTWRLLRHARRPRLVSVVAAPLPDAFAPPRSFLMQAVVLLRSRQALTRRAVRPEPGVGVAAAGRRRQPQQQQQQQQQQQGGKGPEEGEGERQQPFEHDAVEYLVLQKRMWGGKEEVVGEGLDGWRVWGFASETPLKDIRWTRAWREERRKERERLQKGMMEGSTGEEEAGSGQVVGHGKGA
ncbi:hypothetical protein BDY21DRAFT_147275 [Lineolata rhizophorae]|uniref:Uncharacterized protein n=1 Tax=Lineolata rhizophorae TaxID=578093 RepID=A0A6A6NNR6_9PEZI|nr:hypothetical protein BDY21DRAFT_147275 [Lineolata rhizophorae]